MRALIFLPLLALGACANIFAPPYEAALETKLTAAASGVEKIGAALDLGKRDASTYAAFEPQYIEILADLRAARTIAEDRAAIYAGRPSAKAAEAIVTLINNCDSDVVATAQLHKQGELTAKTFELSMTRQVCNLTTKAEAQLKP